MLLRKMILSEIFGVIVILCALVAARGAGAGAGAAADGAVSSAPCDVTVQDDNSYTVNCSRRNIDRILSWPQEIEDISNEARVLITFFNDSITNVTQLPRVPGSRLALSFRSNRIAEIEVDAFRNLERLVYLDLSNNHVTGQVLRSEIFQGPYDNGVYSEIALETLNLGFNEIHSLDKDLFKYTPNLTRLYLNNNPIEILDHVTVHALSTAVKLEMLDLSNTDIDNIPLDAFVSLQNLRNIDLSGNKFTAVPESLRFVGSTLEYLTFNNNPIVELNDDSFNNLYNLKQLEVGNNKNLEEVKRSTFTPLKSLRTLHLCHNTNLNYISHLAFRGLKDRWTLKEVYLDDNNLSELSADLMPWRRLEVLGMTDNPWLCNCDLANIVTRQGAGEKFQAGEIPYCAAPMKLTGAYITNISIPYCPTFDTTFTSKKNFSLATLKPKHVLWSIFGVAMIVCLGMVLGLLANAIKTIYINKIRSQPVRYVNLNEDSTFA